MTTPHRTETGNALWYILIAIILLAALTVMLTRTSTTSEETGSYERQEIKIAEMLRYAKGMEQAVNRLQSQGCSENDISFEQAVVAGYSNPGSPVNKSCHIFEPEGTGLQWQDPPENINDGSTWFIGAANVVTGVGCDTASAACTDLLLILPNVTEATCLRINALNGVANPGGAPPEDNDNSIETTTKFTGSFAQSDTIADTDGELYGQETACVAETAGTTHLFYKVLLKR